MANQLPVVSGNTDIAYVDYVISAFCCNQQTKQSNTGMTACFWIFWRLLAVLKIVSGRSNKFGQSSEAMATYKRQYLCDMNKLHRIYSRTKPCEVQYAPCVQLTDRGCKNVLDRITVPQKMRPIVADGLAWSVCRSVCLSGL